MRARQILYEIKHDDGQEDIIECSLVGEVWVLSGYQPPRYISRHPTLAEAEARISRFIDQGLWSLIRTHLI